MLHIQYKAQKNISFVLFFFIIVAQIIFLKPEVSFAVECLDAPLTVSNPYQSVEVSGKLYVNSEASGSISIIDLSTHTVIQTLNIGTELFFPTRVGNFLYYSDSVGNSVHVFDTTTNTVVTTIPVGSGPKFSILVGTKLYVHNTLDTFISVVDTTTNTVLTTVSMEGTNKPINSTLIGDHLYVNRTGNNGVANLDTNIDALVSGGTPAAPNSQYSVAVGTKLYTNSGTQPLIYVTEVVNALNIGSIPLPSIPLYSIAIGSKIYTSLTASFGTESIGIINSLTDTLVTTVDVGQSSQYATQIGTKIYVSDEVSNSVFIFDTTTDSVITTVSVGSNPRYATAVGSKVYVNNMGSNSISIINNTTNTLFTCPTYSVTYTASTGGTISGTISQTIVEGFDATTVTAAADTGYVFTGWSDGVMTLSRTDNDVVSNLTVSALFTPVANSTPSTSGGNININNSILQSTQPSNTPMYTSPIDGGTQTCNPFNSYLKFNSYKNIVKEVLSWQSYLNKFHNENLALTGFYDLETFNAMKRFQEKYRSEVLTPWNLSSATGYTYKTTRAKANALLGCPEGELLLENGKTVDIK